VAEESIQRRAVLYDKDGDYHYDVISAFIKSLRGSDPDAALYWLAKMVYAGEDPRFLFRRMLILAGEDVGLADPNAIRVVTACAEAFDRVGLPEGRFHLAEAALYLATAPKSNSALGFFDALTTVEQERESDVPVHLKDATRDKEGFGHGEGYLYPHAYRDHWVAQQYLPQTLQGKVFYQPGDQGYERGIHDQVARRREAQLAAMVEDVGEILTFRPGERAHDRWLQRAVGNAGERLGHLRDRVLDAARIQRHHVVLDLNAGTGLLTWEILRRAPEGGTWTLARDRQAGEGLRQLAERLPEMERPVILVGEPEELPALLTLRGEGELRFDAIVGRNTLGRTPDKAAALRLLAGLLRPTGRLSLAETVARHTQRLYDLVGDSSSRLGENLHRRVRNAEEAIYADAGDPLVNWEAADLERLLIESGFGEVTVEVEAQTSDLLVSPAVLGRWFAPDAERDRPSYAQHLLRGITPQELAAVKAEFQRQLAGQTVPWRTEAAFLTAQAG